MDDVGSNGSVVECGLEPHDYLEVSSQVTKFFFLEDSAGRQGLFNICGVRK